eukprot:TRINITY_DN8528_c0_g1_i4.p1 TRINITY_DN8528_c0_g1~~TRINITY_DN8528_c0_g1_i4.p1  ORF type:complete len:416 (+),score=44.74 TRINITY_DN8528_c0_g1_i4:248-1495(+)
MGMGMCSPGASQWVEKLFEECVYSPWQMLGFLMGISSICFWIVAQLPQFLNNFRRKSADALSPAFIVQWLAGDSCNLLGCLLTGDQFITETLTACYFIISDCIMLSQYIYYGYISRSKEIGAYSSESDESLHKPANGYYQAIQSTAASPEKSLDNSGNLSCSNSGSGSGNLESATATTDDKTRASERSATSTATKSQSKQRHRVCPYCNKHQDKISRSKCRVPSCHAHDHNRNNLQRVIMQYGLDYTVRSVRSGPLSVKSSKRGYSEDVRRSQTSKIAFCFTGMLIISLLHCYHHLLSESSNNMAMDMERTGRVVAVGRRILNDVQSKGDVNAQPWLQTWFPIVSTQQLGRLIGWVSSVLYLGSRISQLLKNMARKSVEGLALGMVACATMANLTYGFSILILADSWYVMKITSF